MLKQMKRVCHEILYHYQNETRYFTRENVEIFCAECDLEYNEFFVRYYYLIGSTLNTIHLCDYGYCRWSFEKSYRKASNRNQHFDFKQVVVHHI
jgi:hypothetical protein